MTTTWPVVRLGEVCDIVSGATPKTTDPSLWGGDICWVTPKDLSDLPGKFIHDTPRKLTEKGLRSCSAALLPAGSVLLSSRAPIGLVAVNTVPMATNQGFKSLVPHPDRVDAGYLYWWLVGNQRYLQNLGRGATFAEISKSITAEISLPLPPIEEQRRIAAVLDQANDLRTKRQRSVALLDSLNESIFLDMFGDGDLPSLSLAVVLADAEVFVDGDWVESKDQDPEGDVRLIQLADVGDGYYINKSNRYMTSQKADELKCTYLRPGDVLVARMPDPLGRACIFPGDAKPCVTVVDVCVIRPGPTGPDPVWLCQALNASQVRRQIEQFTTGTTRMRISRKNLSGVKLRVPPLAVQKEFAARMAHVEGLRNAHSRAAAAHRELFGSINARAFAGQL